MWIDEKEKELKVLRRAYAWYEELQYKYDKALGDLVRLSKEMALMEE